MTDRRTRKQKLRDMANQSVSPREAEIAKQKLSEIKEEESTVENNDPFSFNVSIRYAKYPTDSSSSDPMDGLWVLVNGQFVKL